MRKQSEANSVKLLEQLQAIDLALVELNLYLDAMPGDVRALQQNINLNEQRHLIQSQLNDQLGKISSYSIMGDPDNRKWSLAR